MIIRLTNHAKGKIKHRGISIQDVEETVRNPDKSERDKVDEELTHFVKRFHDRYLRVIVKNVKDDIIIISAFFDRRLKRGQGHD